MAKNTEESVTEDEVAGRRIRVVTRGDAEELWIDDEKVKYFVYDDGYTLEAEAYSELLPTLLEAAARWSERHPVQGGA